METSKILCILGLSLDSPSLTSKFNPILQASRPTSWLALYHFALFWSISLPSHVYSDTPASACFCLCSSFCLEFCPHTFCHTSWPSDRYYIQSAVRQHLIHLLAGVELVRRTNIYKIAKLMMGHRNDKTEILTALSSLPVQS